MCCEKMSAQFQSVIFVVPDCVSYLVKSGVSQLHRETEIETEFCLAHLLCLSLIFMLIFFKIFV